MRLVFVVLAAALVAGPASAQNRQVSSAGTPASSAEDAPPQGGLPVSLDHIREGLKKIDSPLLRPNELPADFRLEIVEQQKIDELLKKLDFKTGPAPCGGLYGYEQQQRLFNPTDHPLQQPYAAFSGGEFFTIAAENLIAKYLGGPLVKAVSGAERNRAEHAAREEVDREIAAYCAARPDRADIQLCTTPDR
jgi:hypothetical protein